VDTISGPGTIDDLIADAVGRGHQVTARLVTDWVGHGLLDHPARRPKGRGKGSGKALYPRSQRLLFLTLLDKRQQGAVHVRALAQVPIFLWLYWGEDYVPVRQALRALTTWLGDTRANRDRARQAADSMLGVLDHPSATAAARRELKDVLAEIAYTGRLDRDHLERAVVQVFEPPAAFGRLSRAVGHPGAPLTAQTVIRLIEARVAAATEVQAGRVSEEQLTRCRQVHLATRSEYLALLPSIADPVWGAPRQLYTDLLGPNALQIWFDRCGTDLLTVIGLEIQAGRTSRGQC
jgi:hypothetical protein